ncbi:MAG: winged helix-turn-helix transcriptional regulator [Clostridiales bacterium]|nr:winged helix-turn-helix transcriptional regulator [Clostridiales bacterium]
MKIDCKELIILLTKLNNMIDGFDEFFLTKNNNLTIKDKLLIFLQEKNLTPFELIKKLGINKTNLALITAELVKQELIIKKQTSFDKRNIEYVITDKGNLYIQNILNKIDENINKQLKYYNNAQKINEFSKSLNDILD